MESLDLWRLCEDLTIIQAALLIAGEDPSSLHVNIEEHWEVQNRPDGYEPAKMALKTAVCNGKINAKIAYPAIEAFWVEDLCKYSESVNLNKKIYKNGNHELIVTNEPDWDKTTISVDSLKQWLASRGFSSGFFFPEDSNNISCLNTSHPQYAQKLAIAIMAWDAVTQDTYLLKNKSPKQAIECWLENNASKYDLSKTAVEEIAKIANWKPKGGVASTGTITNQEQKSNPYIIDDYTEVPF